MMVLQKKMRQLPQEMKVYSQTCRMQLQLPVLQKDTLLMKATQNMVLKLIVEMTVLKTEQFQQVC